MAKKRINLIIDNIKLTHTQREIYAAIHDDNYKYVVCNISRQQGKSVLAKLLVTIWLSDSKNDIAYVTPTYKLAQKFFKDINEILKDSKLIKTSNSSQLIITSITGSKLTFYSSEAAENLRGQTFTRIILDEAAFFKDEINGQTLWQIIQPTFKVRGKKMLIISTPLGREGFFFDMYSKALRGEKYYKLIEKTIYDDGLVTPEQIEEIKRDLTTKQFEQEYMVKFLSGSLSYFNNYDKNFINYKFNNNLPCWVGVDFSASGTDETILTVINNINQTIQYKIEGSLDSKYKQISDIINNLNNNLIGAYLESNSIGEVMGNEIIKLIRKDLKHKIHFKHTSNQSKNDYIDYLQLTIDNNEIFFNISNNELLSQLGTFYYTITKSKKIAFAAKAGHKDDRIISLALANLAKKEIKNVKKEYVRVFSR